MIKIHSKGFTHPISIAEDEITVPLRITKVTCSETNNNNHDGKKKKSNIIIIVIIMNMIFNIYITF